MVIGKKFKWDTEEHKIEVVSFGLSRTKLTNYSVRARQEL